MTIWWETYHHITCIFLLFVNQSVLGNKPMAYQVKNTQFSKCSTNVDHVLPKLLIIDEGQKAVMMCGSCTVNSGKNAEKNNSAVSEVPKITVVWMWKPLKESSYENVYTSLKEASVSPKNNLIIEDVTLGMSGTFFCRHAGALISNVYRMDIVSRRKRIQVFSEAKEKSKAAPAVKLPKIRMIIYTHWSSWTSCNRCDKRGERKRVGLCMVKKAHDAHNRKENLIFDYYPRGVPCQSSALPKSVSQLTIIKRRKNEIEWGYCFEPCPTLPPVKYITDSSGNIVEVVESGKGFMSLDEAVPTFAPRVKRRTLYQQEKKMLVLDCPVSGKLEDRGEEAVLWQNQSQIIDALEIYKVSDGRIMVDVMSRLQIYPTEFWDSGIYTCWNRDVHIATIKLHIVTNLKVYDDKIRDRTIHIIVWLFIIAMLLICCNIVRAQRNDTKRFM